MCLCILTHTKIENPRASYETVDEINTNKMQSVIEVSYHGLYQFEFEIIKAFAMVWVSCVAERIAERMAAHFFSCAAQTRLPDLQCIMHINTRTFTSGLPSQCHKRTMLNNNPSIQTNSAFICSTLTSCLCFLSLGVGCAVIQSDELSRPRKGVVWIYKS